MSELSRDLTILSMRIETLLGTFEYDQADEELVGFLEEAAANLKAANKRLATLKRLRERQEDDL